jgi:hypothetical protein
VASQYIAVSSTNATGIIANTRGNAILWTVNVNKGVAGSTLKIYDGVSSSGTLVAEVDASTKSSHGYGVHCQQGIYFELTGNAQATIGYA